MTKAKFPSKPQKFSHAFKWYEPRRFSFYSEPNKPDALNSVLPTELTLPLVREAFSTAAEFRQEIERRLKQVEAIFGVSSGKPDWKRAFYKLAFLAVLGLKATQRGAPSKKDQAFFDRSELMHMARYAANREGKMSIHKVAKLLAQPRNSSQLPESFKGKTHETIRKALKLGFEEELPASDPNDAFYQGIRRDPKGWQRDPLESVVIGWKAKTGK